jgi:hypothetical protein
MRLHLLFSWVLVLPFASAAPKAISIHSSDLKAVSILPPDALANPLNPAVLTALSHLHLVPAESPSNATQTLSLRSATVESALERLAEEHLFPVENQLETRALTVPAGTVPTLVYYCAFFVDICANIKVS